VHDFYARLHLSKAVYPNINMLIDNGSLKLRAAIIAVVLCLLFLSAFKYVDSYPEWAKLEYLRLTDRAKRIQYVYYNLDAIRVDFVARLNDRDQLAPEGLENAFRYESMKSRDAHILKVIVSIEKQRDGSWKLTDSGKVFPVEKYARSLEAALDDLENIPENMPAAMVRASFLKTHFSSIQIANEFEVVLEIFNDLKG
tara:strand:+ start:1857 stop:2450 length:594 start_codon:yes stop_codon:yes gene_type:complete